MKNLLQFEMKKLVKARVFYICAIVIVATVLVLMGTQKLTEVISQNIMGGEVSPDELLYDSEQDQEILEDMGMGIFSSARTGLAWVLNALNSTYVFIAFGAFVAVWFLSDYTSRTVQHEITKGYSRTEIFFSKYLSSLFVCLIYALLAMFVGFLMGTIFWKVGKGFDGKFILQILVQLVIIAAFNSLFCFFATMGFKVAPALILSIAIPIAVPMIFALVDLFLQMNSVEEGGNALQLSKYWLSGMISRVARIKAENKDILYAFLGGAGYLVVLTFFSWLFAKKRDA